MASNIDKIIVNANRTKATIYYTFKEPVNIFSDTGRVLELIDFITAPIGFNSWLEYYKRLIASREITKEIDLTKLKE